MRTKRTTTERDPMIEALEMDAPNERRPGRPWRFKPAEVANALLAEHGIATQAARRLACDTWTVQRYMRRYKSVAAAREEGLVLLRDLAESVVVKALRQGDAQMARWVLRSNLGGSEWREQPRGIEVAGPGGEAPVVVLPAMQFSSLDEWAAAARGGAAAAE